MIRSILDKRFKYTPASQTSVDYLRERFAKIRADIEANKREQEEKVSTIKPRVKARTA